MRTATLTSPRQARSAMEAIRSGSVQLTRATEDQIAAQMRLNSTFQAQAGAVGGFRSRMSRLSQSFRIQQGAIQQAGFQFQDFAVQVGAGQSALVAFSQQGSQLAGILGPGGAILGAVIAIGAAIAGPFVAGMGEGEESIEDFTERTMELVEALGEATRRQREFIDTQFAQRVTEQQAAIVDAQEAIFRANREMETFTRRLSDQEVEALRSAGAFDKWTDALDQARLTIDNAESSIRSIKDEQTEFWEGVKQGGDDAEEARNKVQELVNTFKDQAATLNLTARETTLYKLQRLEANGADREAVALARQQINASFDKIDAFEQEEQRLKLLREQYRVTAQDDPLLQRVNAQDRGQDIIASIRQEAEAVRMGLDQEFAIRQAHKDRVMALEDGLRLGVIASEEERARLELESLRQRNEQIRQLEAQKNQIFTQGQTKSLELTGQFFGNLASIAQAGGEDAFQRYKNLASAQAAIAAALSIASVLGDPTVPAFLKVPLAFSIGGIALAQVDSIQSQEYQGSYLGGGYTGDGPRSGGIDGRGGFPAILHPNETVIDNERTPNMGGGVVINIMNAPAGTRTETRQDMDGRQVIDIIVADMQSGGPASRSMQQVYGLRRQGR